MKKENVKPYNAVFDAEKCNLSNQNRYLGNISSNITNSQFGPTRICKNLRNPKNSNSKTSYIAHLFVGMGMGFVSMIVVIMLMVSMVFSMLMPMVR